MFSLFMFRLLKFLLIGDFHLHKWQVIRKVDIYDEDCEKAPTGRKYECSCHHCGVIKSFRV